MRLLHVVHCFPPEPIGGTEAAAMALVRGLAARGHEVGVVAGSLEWTWGFRVDREECAGIPVTRIHRDDPWFDRWDAGYHPGVEAAFRAELRRLQPDLVHVHHWIRLTRNLVQVARQEGVPAVVHLHDFHATCPRTFRIDRAGRFCTRPPGEGPCPGCVERWPFQGETEVRSHLDHHLRDLWNELRAASLRLAPSAAHGRAVTALLPGEAGPVAVLPPGREELLSPRPRTPRTGPFRLAHWGNLYDLKGTLVLLQALRLASPRAALSLAILGRASEPEFEALLAREAAGLPVTLSGPFAARELEELAADAAVFPSLCHESYGLVLDEAFMLGLPVVVADAGALPERAGGAALVVPAGDAAALADALVRIATEPGLAPTLAARIPRSWATAAEVAARAEALYGEVLAGRHQPLPPVHPLGPVQRLHLAWFTAAARLASLGGGPVATPPPWRTGAE